MNESVSVIIISYNCKQYVEDCIKSIIFTCYELIPEIIIVDNNSTDGTVDYISSLYPEVIIINNEINKGYAAAINIGVNASTGDYLILSNADIVYKKDSIFGLVDKVKSFDNKIIVSPQQVFSSGKYQRSFGYFPSIKRGLFDLLGITRLKLLLKKKSFENGNKKDFKVEYLDGAVICTTRLIFNKLYGFDERFFFYSEEADFCYRAKIEGYESVLTPEYQVIHHRGGSQENKGMNEESINMLIESEARFIDIHNNSFTKWVYFRLELLFFKLLLLLSKTTNDTARTENNKKYIKAIKSVLNGN